MATNLSTFFRERRIAAGRKSLIPRRCAEIAAPKPAETPEHWLAIVFAPDGRNLMRYKLMYAASLTAMSPVVSLYTQPAPPATTVVIGDWVVTTTVLFWFAPICVAGKGPRKYGANAVLRFAAVGYALFCVRYRSIAVRTTVKDCCVLLLFALLAVSNIRGVATAAMMPNSRITTTNSTRVKADRVDRAFLLLPTMVFIVVALNFARPVRRLRPSRSPTSIAYVL